MRIIGVGGYIQFCTFAFIGIVNTIVHGIVLAINVEFFGVAIVISHLISFMIANIFSYVMNSRLTFKVDLSFHRYLRFFSASLLALMVTLMIAWLMERLQFHYLVGYIAVVMVVPVITFFIIRTWAFAGYTSEPKSDRGD